MSSGNFLIGDRLLMAGFNAYVVPALKEQGIKVPDKITVKESEYNEKILCSLVGCGDLEQLLNKTLVETGDRIEAEEIRKKQEELEYERIAYSYEIKHAVSLTGHKGVRYSGKFSTIGVYDLDTTASQLFPSLVQEYHAKRLNEKLEKIDVHIRAIGKRLA